MGWGVTKHLVKDVVSSVKNAIKYTNFLHIHDYKSIVDILMLSSIEITDENKYLQKFNSY